MRIGDVIEVAMWLDGRETPEIRRQFEADMTEAVRRQCAASGLGHLPVTYRELRPGEPRVPDPPKHLTGREDIRLLVAEAEVVPLPAVKTTSFLADLDPVDLRRLREITRRVHRQRRPLDAEMSDADCDAVIEEIGPEAAYDAVRKAVDGGTVH